MRCGSVPALDHFRRTPGAYSVCFGFSRDGEGFHAPNEFLRLESFQQGLVGKAMLYDGLASLDPADLRAPTVQHPDSASV